MPVTRQPPTPPDLAQNWSYGVATDLILLNPGAPLDRYPMALFAPAGATVTVRTKDGGGTPVTFPLPASVFPLVIMALDAADDDVYGLFVGASVR